MPDFLVSFEGRSAFSRTTHRLYNYTRDQAIEQAKKIGNEKDYRTIYISYMGSSATVGYWVKKGSRWYKV